MSYLESIAPKGATKLHLVCAHGLNQNPEALKPLLMDFAAQGIHCHLMHLPGHCRGGSIEAVDDRVTMLETYRGHFQKVQKLAGPNLEVAAFGYSYGGLLTVAQPAESPACRLLLLAPALAVHPHTHLVGFVARVFPGIRSIPVGSPHFEAHYRFYRKSVPSGIYKGFFSVYKSFLEEGTSWAEGQEALVFAHPRDELVSFKRLQKFCEQKSSWVLKAVSNKEAPFRRYNHLMFDRHTLGDASYQQLVDASCAFLLKDT